MFKMNHKGRIAAFVAVCMLSLAAPVRAESASQYRSQFGAQVVGGRYDREIVVDEHVRGINVVSGQVIRFVVIDVAGTSASFTWNFDTWGERTADLSRLAPDGMVLRPTRIYIANDPRYGGA